MAIDVAPGVRLHTYPAADGDGPPGAAGPGSDQALLPVGPRTGRQRRRAGDRPRAAPVPRRVDRAAGRRRRRARPLRRHAAGRLPGHRDRADRFRDRGRGGPLAGRHPRRDPRGPPARAGGRARLLEAPLRFGAAAGSFAPFVAATPAATLETVRARRGTRIVPGQVSAPRRPGSSPRAAAGPAAQHLPARRPRRHRDAAHAPARAPLGERRVPHARRAVPRRRRAALPRRRLRRRDPGDRRRAGRARHAATHR